MEILSYVLVRCTLSKMTGAYSNRYILVRSVYISNYIGLYYYKVIEKINNRIMSEQIIDALLATCICAVAVGLPLCIYVAIAEFFADKFNLYDKISKFFDENTEE